MIQGVNGLAHFTSAFAFENGWTITVCGLNCGHHEIVIVPRHLHENEGIGGADELRNNPYYWRKAMRARGDYIDHFDGNDAELLNLITEVKFRDQEPSLKKISQDIMKAVKS